MSIRKPARSLIIIAASVVLAACGGFSLSGATPIPARHILFIGNSYTYMNGGIDQQLKGLAPSSEVSSIAVGGYALQQHWDDPNTLQTIRKGGWDFVVLQEQSQTPVFNRDQYYDYARRFDAEIRKVGARTVLLMTWERPDSAAQGVTTANLASATITLGAQLGVKVAPAGKAFAASLAERPDLVLYSADGHPTVYGTYLAACVLYATIYEASPEGNPYADWSLSAEVRTYFQRVAAKTLGY